MRVTPSDRDVIPDTAVLAKVPDARVEQFWDPHRFVSLHALVEWPDSIARANADSASVGPPVVWDTVALFGPEARWTRRMPPPEWAGHPVVDVTEPLGHHLADALARSGRTPSAPSHP
jgi:hypothetical protein